ncbi:MAG: hypothetical protein ACLT0Y_05825 [Christensenellales bacterium]
MLGIDENSDCRIEFNEITEKAVKNAIEHARPMWTARRQQARRILDRLVGYKSARSYGKGAHGRPQGGYRAVRMICDETAKSKRLTAGIRTLSASFPRKSRAKFEAKLER